MTVKDDRLRKALGRVLERRFGEGKARGTRAELGRVLGAEGRAAEQRGWRIVDGQLFPDRDLAAVAEFVGLSLTGLMREVTAELVAMERESAHDKKSRKNVE